MYRCGIVASSFVRTCRYLHVYKCMRVYNYLLPCWYPTYLENWWVSWWKRWKRGWRRWGGQWGNREQSFISSEFASLCFFLPMITLDLFLIFHLVNFDLTFFVYSVFLPIFAIFERLENSGLCNHWIWTCTKSLKLELYKCNIVSLHQRHNIFKISWSIYPLKSKLTLKSLRIMYVVFVCL